MAKNQNSFNPVKEEKDGILAKRMVWSTEALKLATKGLEDGRKLVANPFYENNIKLLKGDLVFQRTEEERAEVEGLTRILVEVCLDWDADSNGSFGKGIGFKDGAIFVPEFAKMDINLCRHIINNGGSGKNAIHIDAGAQANIYSGTVVGGIYVNQHADARINVSTGNDSAYSGSIFGEGSLTMIVAILTLVVSCISLFLTVHYNKKKAVPVAANGVAETETDDEE